MDHYSTGIASTLARAAADAYRPHVDTDTIRQLWQADDAEFIEDDDSTALLNVAACDDLTGQNGVAVVADAVGMVLG